MARISNKEIMDQLMAMQTMMSSIIAEQESQRTVISALQKGKVSNPKSTAKKTATTTVVEKPKTRREAIEAKYSEEERKAWDEAKRLERTAEEGL